MTNCKCKKGDVVFTKLQPSTRKNKKMMMLYYKSKKDDKPYKVVHFGAKGYEDFTLHKDEKKKQNYYKRHNKEMNCPKSANTLAKMILWNKKTIDKSYKDYLDTHNFKKF